MNQKLEHYLHQVESHLHRLQTSERLDILREIKSTMLEMEQAGQTPDAIIARLGNPRDLARAYLSDLLNESPGFSWNHFLTLLTFYGSVGLSGIFIIPSLAIMGYGCIIGGYLSIIAIIVRFGALSMGFAPEFWRQFLHIGIPGIQGNLFAETIVGLLITSGIVWCGIKCWHLLTAYFKHLNKAKRKMQF